MNNFRLIPSGTAFGKCSITGVIDEGGAGKHARYSFKCRCGYEGEIRSTSIRKASPDTTCGKCLTYLTGNPANAKALYNTWLAMVTRCHRIDEDDPNYDRYRGRGISVCLSWRADPLEFVRWAVKKGYAKGLELDRKDNDGNYTPKNCRLVDRRTNVNNRECSKLVNFKGRKNVPFSEVVEEFGIVSYTTAFHRYFKRGWTLLEAVTTPARPMR